jgi:hypothetical protein
VNGKIYCLPNINLTRGGQYYPKGGYPDSSVVASSFSLSTGEIEKYHGQHNYSPLLRGSSITSYYDEILLTNLGYSDTLFTLLNNKLTPLYLLRVSNKIKRFEEVIGSSACELVSAYKNGIVFLKISLVKDSNPWGYRFAFDDFYRLYDRERNVFKISNIRVMNSVINHEGARLSPISSYLPVTCGKYAYMMVERDVLKELPAHFDPKNDNPIIIVGTLK